MSHPFLPRPARRVAPPLFAVAVAAACAGRAAPPSGPPTLPGAAPAASPFGSPAVASYRPGMDVLHYHVELDLTRTEAVSARALLDVVVVGAADELVLDLLGMEVTGVRIAPRAAWRAEEPPPASFRRAAGALRVGLPPGAAPGDTLRVAIDYRGTPTDGLILRRTVHGQPAAFADNWPDRARHWLPSIDHPSDKATVSWTVRAPGGWEVVANGARLTPEGPAGGEATVGGDVVWNYRMEVPVPTYTMVVGATDFAIHEVADCAPGGATPLRPDGCVQVTAWLFPPDSAHGARAFRRAGDMVAYYAELVAPFPYHKLAHAQSATRFGGMENAGAIFYAEEPLAAGADIEPTVAHETAHQWFGDAVTEADWRHLWLSEGFATYFGALYFEHADGRARFREMLAEDAAAYLDSEVVDEPVVDPGRPATERLLDLLNENQYQKGAWVLHMLRGLLGDEAFFEGVRAYYRSHAPGNAVTEDFRRALEGASGRELDWFFEQWLYRPGHPVLRASWGWEPESRTARVTIEQAQPARWPTFRVPLTLAFDTPEGEVRRTIDVTARSETFRLELPATPTGLRIDPDGWVLARAEPPRRVGG